MSRTGTLPVPSWPKMAGGLHASQPNLPLHCCEQGLLGSFWLYTMVQHRMAWCISTCIMPSIFSEVFFPIWCTSSASHPAPGFLGRWPSLWPQPRLVQRKPCLQQLSKMLQHSDASLWHPCMQHHKFHMWANSQTTIDHQDKWCFRVMSEHVWKIMHGQARIGKAMRGHACQEHACMYGPWPMKGFWSHIIMHANLNMHVHACRWSCMVMNVVMPCRACKHTHTHLHMSPTQPRALVLATKTHTTCMQYHAIHWCDIAIHHVPSLFLRKKVGAVMHLANIMLALYPCMIETKQKSKIPMTSENAWPFHTPTFQWRRVRHTFGAALSPTPAVS